MTPQTVWVVLDEDQFAAFPTEDEARAAVAVLPFTPRLVEVPVYESADVTEGWRVTGTVNLATGEISKVHVEPFVWSRIADGPRPADPIVSPSSSSTFSRKTDGSESVGRLVDVAAVGFYRDATVEACTAALADVRASGFGNVTAFPKGGLDQ